MPAGQFDPPVPFQMQLDSALSPSSPAGKKLPLSVDNTGWVSGTKTVSCTIDDGLAPASITLSAEDASTGVTGDAIILADTATTSVASSSARRVYKRGDYTSDANNQVEWNLTWDEMLNAPVTVGSTGTTYTDDKNIIGKKY